VHANFPRLLDQDGLAYLGWDWQALALGLAAADLLRDLVALLHQDVIALLLWNRDALLFVVEATDLLGNLGAGLVAAIGQWHLNVAAHLSQGSANLLLDFVADHIWLDLADVLRDGGADGGLLLAANDLLGVLLASDEVLD